MKGLNALVGIPTIAAIIYFFYPLLIDLFNYQNSLATSGNIGSSSLLLLACIILAALLISLAGWGIRLLVGSAQRPLLVVLGEDTVLMCEKDNYPKEYFSEEHCFWRWGCNKRFKGMYGVSYSELKVDRVLQEVRRVQPITTNPKVRNICYLVSFDLNQSLKGKNLASLQKRRSLLGDHWYGDISVTKIMKSALYEFSEAKSKEIAEFYNPEDPKQQEKFSNLVKSWMSEIMAGSPFIITNVTFSLD